MKSAKYEFVRTIRNKNTVLLFVFFVSFRFSLIAQYKFRIDFTDKNNSPYSLANPSEYLSQRAIERRNKQNILPAENDLPVNENYIDSILHSGNIQLHNRSKWLNAITISSDDSTLMNLLGTYSFVKNAKRVKRTNSNFSEEKFSPSPSERGQGVRSYDYGKASNQVQMLNADFLHKMGFKGEGMLIAVIDAGFIAADTLNAFKNLYETNRVIATRNFVDGGSYVYKNATHGTEVLSTMAANLPGLIIGTAPEASYILLISEDMFSETVIEEDNWVSAAEFADSAGADVINSSLGYTIFDSVAVDSFKVVNPYNHTYAEMDGNTARATIGADVAACKGILVVNSAGNSGSGAWNFIGVPADGDSVLAIGAVDASRKYAYFSSNGPSADGRVKPNVSAQGQNTIIIFPFANDSVSPGSGTSFSSPIIAGASACLWQAAKNKTNMQVFNAIEESASQYNNPDTLLGYGIPNFRIAYEILTGKKAVDFTSDTLIIFPNPFSEKFIVDFYSTIVQSITIEIFDLRGQLILYSEKNTVEGLNEFIFHEQDIPSKSVYSLRLTTENAVIRKLFVKI